MQKNLIRENNDNNSNSESDDNIQQEQPSTSGASTKNNELNLIEALNDDQIKNKISSNVEKNKKREKLFKVIQEIETIIRNQNEININDENLILYFKNIKENLLLQIPIDNHGAFMQLIKNVNCAIKTKIENKKNEIKDNLEKNKLSWWWCATIVLTPLVIINHIVINSDIKKNQKISDKFKNEITTKFDEFEENEITIQQTTSQVTTSTSVNLTSSNSSISSLSTDIDSEKTPLLPPSQQKRTMSC